MKSKKVQYSILHLEMIKRVVDFALSAAYVAITNASVPFKTAIAFIQGNTTLLDALWAQKSTIITGYAAQKRAAKEALVKLSWSIMHPSLAFAINSGNDNLRASMDFSISQLNKMSYSGLVSRVQASYDALKPYFTNVAAYNVTTQMTTDWLAAKVTLANLMSAPKMAINQRKSINADFQKLLGNTVTYMSDVMDPMAVLFANDHPQYYADYLNNRMLHPRVIHTKFRVVVTDDQNNGIPLVEVLQDGTDNKALTNLKGECALILQLDNTNYTADKKNIYSFTLSADTLSTNLPNIEIGRGKSVTRKVKMQTTGFVLPEAKKAKDKATA